MSVKPGLLIALVCAALLAPVICFGQALEEAVFFTVQVGSYSNEAHARAFQETLAKKKYPAYLSELPNPGGKPVYKLRIGKFKTRKEAEAFGTLFQKREKMSYLIVSVASARRTTPTAEAQTAVDYAVPAEGKELLSSSPSPALPLPPRPEEKGVQENTAPEKLVGADKTIPWPESSSTIYVYKTEDESLHVTNRADQIPERLRARIESVSTFPVMFLAFEPETGTLRLKVDGKEESVKLIGTAFPSSQAIRSASVFCETNLMGMPLRFEYCPAKRDLSGLLPGRLGLREGNWINLELVRQGIASYSAEGVPLDQQTSFEAAEAAAKKEKIGIWRVPPEKEEPR
jgi:hypothetical protein